MDRFQGGVGRPQFWETGASGRSTPSLPEASRVERRPLGSAGLFLQLACGQHSSALRSVETPHAPLSIDTPAGKRDVCERAVPYLR